MGAWEGLRDVGWVWDGVGGCGSRSGWEAVGRGRRGRSSLVYTPIMYLYGLVLRGMVAGWVGGGLGWVG